MIFFFGHKTVRTFFAYDVGSSAIYGYSRPPFVLNRENESFTNNLLTFLLCLLMFLSYDASGIFEISKQGSSLADLVTFLYKGKKHS